ncbi:MAG TPA: TerB family tellurite resistance protein [Polyangiaceae bacterium]
MHEQNMAILKGLVSVAWADGRVAGEELEVIEALLQAFEATPSEAAEVRLYAKQERALGDISVTELSHDDRRVLLQHAVLLTYIDGEQHEKEKKILEALCETLRIPSIEAQGIVAAAEKRAKDFLNLL